MSHYIRCKCGRYTNYGLTCSNCRGQYFIQKEYDDSVEDSFEESEVEAELSYEELADFLNKDEDED